MGWENIFGAGMQGIGALGTLFTMPQDYEAMRAAGEEREAAQREAIGRAETEAEGTRQRYGDLAADHQRRMGDIIVPSIAEMNQNVANWYQNWQNRGGMRGQVAGEALAHRGQLNAIVGNQIDPIRNQINQQLHGLPGQVADAQAMARRDMNIEGMQANRAETLARMDRSTAFDIASEMSGTQAQVREAQRQNRLAAETGEMTAGQAAALNQLGEFEATSKSRDVRQKIRETAKRDYATAAIQYDNVLGQMSSNLANITSNLAATGMTTAASLLGSLGGLSQAAAQILATGESEIFDSTVNAIAADEQVRYQAEVALPNSITELGMRESEQVARDVSGFLNMGLQNYDRFQAMGIDMLNSFSPALALMGPMFSNIFNMGQSLVNQGMNREALAMQADQNSTAEALGWAGLGLSAGQLGLNTVNSGMDFSKFLTNKPVTAGAAPTISNTPPAGNWTQIQSWQNPSWSW